MKSVTSLDHKLIITFVLRANDAASLYFDLKQIAICKILNLYGEAIWRCSCGSFRYHRIGEFFRQAHSVFESGPFPVISVEFLRKSNLKET